MKIRCSSLPKIMTNPRVKSEVLSETAKSEMIKIAKEDFYGYSSQMTNKHVEKGIEVEDKSIELLSLVKFAQYTKNKVRVNNEFLTGECDINDEVNDEIIDIKSSWSLETFPALPSDINIKDYEMQLRGYMMLYDRSKASVCYCMVSTPEGLTMYENKLLHEVDHIDPFARVTMLTIERDLEIEKQIEERCKLAIDFYYDYIRQLSNKNV
jgi:hypothetical protein